MPTANALIYNSKHSELRSKIRHALFSLGFLRRTLRMIIETGIHDAIAHKLNEKNQLLNRAVAEGIINNVRKTIISDQLTALRFYAELNERPLSATSWKR